MEVQMLVLHTELEISSEEEIILEFLSVSL